MRASGLIGFYFLFGKPVESVNGGAAYLAEESLVRSRLRTESG